MITRTIKTTTLDAFCVDRNSRETFSNPVTLAGTYADERKLLKAVSKAVDTELVKVIAADNVKVVETLYGMDEETFIKNAQILPARNKPVETEKEN